jgi:MFS superfamily sulfate permease-like transporter
MNWKRLLAALVLADFSALTAYAVFQHGYVSFFELAFANAVTVTLFADLLISLTLVMIWMWNDARRRGITPLPFVLLTLTLGSVGPLLYLVTTLRAATETETLLGRPESHLPNAKAA